MVTGAARVWTTPGPDFGDYLYGVISYGAGWMAIWSHALTPLVSGNIVYGQELLPTGQPVPAQAAQALFVEPMTGYNRWCGVATTAGKGVVFAAKNFRQVEGQLVGDGFSMLLSPAEPRRVMGNTQVLNLGMPNSGYYAMDNTLGPPAACLRESAGSDDRGRGLP